MESIIQYNTLKRILKKVRFSIKLLLDRKYWTVDIYDWLKIIDNWKKNKYNYIADRFDCDDFARLFKCYVTREYKLNAVGFVVDWLKRHSYNIVVTSDLSIYVVEPQTGDVWKYENRPRDKYLCNLSLIIF